MILEAALLQVREGQADPFEAAFREASAIIAASPGYLGHELQRCVEVTGRYLLLVRWETLGAHTVGFRGSPAYAEWHRLLHHFYDPFPTVEHFVAVALDAPEGWRADASTQVCGADRLLWLLALSYAVDPARRSARGSCRRTRSPGTPCTPGRGVAR
jgi:heme-degrading monooxygenase HmoA